MNHGPTPAPGTDQSPDAGESLPEVPAEEQRRRINPAELPSSRGLYTVVAIVAALAVLALAVLVIVRINPTKSDPEATAKRYMELLAEGKANEALSMSADSPAINGSRLLLTDQVLQGATNRLVYDTMSPVSPMGNMATVNVQFSVNGMPGQGYLSLERSTGSTGAAGEWKIQTPLVTPMRFTSINKAVLSISGVKFSLEKTEMYSDVPFVSDQSLFPGTYNLDAAGGKYLEPSTQVLEVGTQGISMNGSAVTQRQTPAARQEILRHLKEQAALCAKPDSGLSCLEHVWARKPVSVTLIKGPETFSSMMSEGDLGAQPPTARTDAIEYRVVYPPSTPGAAAEEKTERIVLKVGTTVGPDTLEFGPVSSLAAD